MSSVSPGRSDTVSMAVSGAAGMSSAAPAKVVAAVAGMDHAAVEAVCQWLLQRECLKPLDLQRARRLQQPADGSLTGLLVRLGMVSERDVAEAWADQLGVPLLVAADVAELPPPALELSPRFLRFQQAVPIQCADGQLAVALADPADRYPLDAIALAADRPVALWVGLRSEIEALIERGYGSGRSAMGTIVEHLDEAGSAEDDVEHLRDLASEAPVIRLVNLLLQRAVEQRASDVHIEPYDATLKVRYRIDGVLHEVESPPASSTAAVISRIKIMARMNIAERRLPQDGRIVLRVQGRELDVRVSTVPTGFGESVVMRLLDRQSVVLDFAHLGFDADFEARLLEVLERPHGIVLATGPTGSGKTTTLYTALARLNTDEVKIITVEDPVEYQLKGINQIQVKPQIGLDFATALRSILRQDPDILMVGEMRDLETCRIAIQSALTGHRVLSTLHTNHAAGGITRLLDMGVEDYLLASTVNALLAQRLVRRLDPELAIPYQPSSELIERFELDRHAAGAPLQLWRPGSSAANPTGFRGRCAIVELLVMEAPIQRLVMQHAGEQQLEAAARSAGMRTMYEDGIDKALRGLTTLEEVLRVTHMAA